MKIKSFLAYAAFFIGAIFTCISAFGVTTANLAKTEESTDLVVYNTTGSHAGGADTLIVSLPSGFTASDYDDGVITILTDTDEATADSVRFNLQVQGKSYPAAAGWHTYATFVDTNSTAAFVNVYNPTTYGKAFQYRLLYVGHETAAPDTTAAQNVTTTMVFNKD